MTLGDDTQGAPVAGFACATQGVVQTVHPLRAQYASSYDRGGRTVRVGWQVTREHASEAAAMVHAIVHESDVPGKGVLAISQESGQGSAVRYYDVVMGSVACVGYDGVSTTFRYEFIGGASRRKKVES